MLSLIVVFLFALGVAYFAIQNVFAVPIVFGSYVLQNVPLYFVVIASMLVGILLASLISSIDTLAAYMKLRGKENRIHSDEKAIDNLQQKVHDLEVQNAELKSAHNHPDARTAHTEIATTEDEQAHRRPTLLGGLLHPHAKV